MSIEKWLEYKKEFREIMRELNEPKVELVKEKNTSGGRVVRIEGVKVDKAELRMFVANFAKPEYVDYKKGEPHAIIRFTDTKSADKFIEDCNNKTKLKALHMNDITVRKLTKEEEDEYLVLVEKRRQDFQQYKATKKKKYDE